MDAFLPLVLGGLFGGGAGSRSSAADEAALESAQGQKEIKDYLLGKAKTVYDPIREQKILPALLSRSQTAPFYARQAMREAKDLQQPMLLQYA